MNSLDVEDGDVLANIGSSSTLSATSEYNGASRSCIRLDGLENIETRFSVSVGTTNNAESPERTRPIFVGKRLSNSDLIETGNSVGNGSELLSLFTT